MKLKPPPRFVAKPENPRQHYTKLTSNCSPRDALHFSELWDPLIRTEYGAREGRKIGNSKPQKWIWNFMNLERNSVQNRNWARNVENPPDICVSVVKTMPRVKAWKIQTARAVWWSARADFSGQLPVWPPPSSSSGFRSRWILGQFQVFSRRGRNREVRFCKR